MKENEFMFGLATGIIITALFMGVLIISPLFSIAMKYGRVLNDCEKTLPRDQHCKVIGVVDNELENK